LTWEIEGLHPELKGAIAGIPSHSRRAKTISAQQCLDKIIR